MNLPESSSPAGPSERRFVLTCIGLLAFYLVTAYWPAIKAGVYRGWTAAEARLGRH